MFTEQESVVKVNVKTKYNTKQIKSILIKTQINLSFFKIIFITKYSHNTSILSQYPNHLKIPYIIYHFTKTPYIIYHFHKNSIIYHFTKSHTFFKIFSQKSSNNLTHHFPSRFNLPITIIRSLSIISILIQFN